MNNISAVSFGTGNYGGSNSRRLSLVAPYQDRNIPKGYEYLSSSYRSLNGNNAAGYDRLDIKSQNTGSKKTKRRPHKRHDAVVSPFKKIAVAAMTAGTIAATALGINSCNKIIMTPQDGEVIMSEQIDSSMAENHPVAIVNIEDDVIKYEIVNPVNIETFKKAANIADGVITSNEENRYLLYRCSWESIADGEGTYIDWTGVELVPGDVITVNR